MYEKWGCIISEICCYILNKKSSNSILIVGIDGKSCSGKSFLAKRLHTALLEHSIDSSCISIDDFCNSRNIRYDLRDNEEGLLVYYNNFNDELFKIILNSAYINSSLNYSGYHIDVNIDLPTKYIEINLKMGGVLIVEGLHLFKKKFSKYFTIKILLHISDDEQIKRAIKRNYKEKNNKKEIINKYIRRFIPSYKFYLYNDEPHKAINFTINNNNINKPFLILNNNEL